MGESLLSVVDAIGPERGREAHKGRHTFLVASSFEPRSAKSSAVIEKGTFDDAIIFNYQDTLDLASGRFHAQTIREELQNRLAAEPFVLPCSFARPYSVVHALSAMLKRQGLDIGCVTIDISCFTKLHLLLLLRYLHEEIGVPAIRVCYTEPLTYATAYGKALSYGTTKTISLPYKSGIRKTNRVALMAFMGHERSRLERILQELEPDLAVVILGSPGFSANIREYSENINRGLIMRASLILSIDLLKCLSFSLGQSTCGWWKR